MPTDKLFSCDVACLGILVADAVGVPIDALPPRGTLALLDRVELHTGGNGANTSAALAKLGVSVSLLGKVGRDNLGDFVIGSLARHGVHVGGVLQDNSAPTAATMVIVHSDAERSFLHAIGANTAFGEADVDWDKTNGASIFHIAGPQLMPQLEGDPLARICREAKRRGMTTVLDTVMNPRSQGWEGIAPCLPYLDWFVPSLDEAVALLETEQGDLWEVLEKRGVQNVAVKCAKEGCWIKAKNRTPLHVPAFPVDAMDSLGAGDCWAAGFVTGLLRGWPLDKIGQFANAVGACSVQALGATTGVLPEAETWAWVAAQAKDGGNNGKTV